MFVNTLLPSQNDDLLESDELWGFVGIAPGQLVDLVVLSADYLEIPEGEIISAR